MPDQDKMTCPDCGTEMNHHADKLDYGATAGDSSEASDEPDGAVVIEAHTCPGCGHAETRPAAS